MIGRIIAVLGIVVGLFVIVYHVLPYVSEVKPYPIDLFALIAAGFFALINLLVLVFSKKRRKALFLFAILLTSGGVFAAYYHMTDEENVYDPYSDENMTNETEEEQNEGFDDGFGDDFDEDFEIIEEETPADSTAEN